MFSALFSFLGGSVFRMIWGELSAYFTAKQTHAQEIERMRLQAELDAAQHARNLAAIEQQAKLGIETIRVQGEQIANQVELQGWASAVASAQKPSGIWFVDAWNGIIRPLAASIAIGLWVIALREAGWKMSEWDRELVGVVLGFFFASRVLTKSGK